MNTQTLITLLRCGLMLLLPVGFCCAVASHIIYRSKHPYKNPKAAKAVWITVAVLFGGALIGGGLFFLDALYNFTAKGKVSSANSNARTICAAFQTAVMDMDEKGELPENCEALYTGYCGDEAEEGTVAWYMNRYCSQPLYYAVVTDENWEVRYALASSEPITPDKIRLYTASEQYESVSGLLRRHEALVGCYNYEEHRKAQHEFDRKQKLREIESRQEAGAS